MNSSSCSDCDGPAVEVQDVYKSYGSRKASVPVLRSCSLCVSQGHIYGLLGPSGCGKTTLLRCIVGRLHVESGHVRVLGKKPGTKGSGVPGKTVGYMPQEMALYNEFTISETMFFFGRVHGMSSADIIERTDFLVSFLELPANRQRLVSELSGGQRRRVSLAVALLHSPRVLILDEPTVGVDPLLRTRIWDHLIGVANSGRTTVVITTHYIEEARQANMVGLMREGRILAQSCPNALVQLNMKKTLEEVFLHLCIIDEQNEEERSKQTLVEGTEIVTSSSASLVLNLAPQEDLPPVERSSCSSCTSVLPKFRNCLALSIKNATVLKRKIGFLLFQFLLPAVQISLFSLCIGNSPYDLPVGVVNLDTGVALGMNLSIAANYLDVLDKKTLTQHHYSTVGEAIDSVRRGEDWAVLAFGTNFTADFVQRVLSPITMDNWTADGSSVKLWLDTTNQQISLTIVAAVTNAFEDLSSHMAQQLNGSGIVFPSSSSALPLIVENPVYGLKNPTFLDFMAPGVILTIIYFMATGLTALSFVLERKEGLMERSLVSGVTMVEVMIGHVATQFVVMSMQAAVLLVFALAIFQIQCIGSLVLVIVLVLLQGLCGMALGLIISALASDEMAATQAALGTVYPMLIVSGIIWPLEGMPPVIRYISLGLPMTYSGEAMRFILGRGWDLTYAAVWRGFLMPIGWGWALCLASALIIMLKGV